MRRTLSLSVFLILSTRLFAGVVIVTNVDDSGPGSLRQALLDLPSCPRPCTVGFEIPGTPPDGHWTIEPLSPLPFISGPSQVTIDGRSQTAFGGDTNPNGPEVILSGASAGMTAGLAVRLNDFTLRGLGFEDWYSAGVSVSGSLGLYLQPVRMSRITIVDNSFGAASNRRVGPNGNGIALLLVEDVVVAGNVISGNQLGMSAMASLRVHVVNNNIGMAADKTTTLGNATAGIRFLNGVQDSVVERNLIAGNQAAITIEGMSSRGIVIDRNQMIDNGFGIDLRNDGPTANDAADVDSGPNALQNHPVLKRSGRTLRGELDSTPDSDFDVDIYETAQAGSNQGRRYLGTITVVTDSKGQATFSFIVPAGSGPYFTATAMSDTERSTSEFCNPVG